MPAPVGIDTWIKQQESDSLFSQREGESPLLKFVQVGEANRINTEQQSRLLLALRMYGDFFNWPWMQKLCDRVEDLQTTCTGPHGAREMLLEAVQFDQLARHDRGRTNITLSGDGAKPR